MSFDLNLPTVCDHKVYRELAIMDGDQRSLRLSKPISSSKLQVYADDNLIPSSMYDIVVDPLTINVNQPKMIYFKTKWISPSDYFEVNYITLLNFCPKCVGLKVLNDISYDVRGGLKEIRNEYLLLQNVEKFTITEIQSNPFQPFIGTSLTALIGERIFDINFLVSKITQEINTTLEKFKSLQSQYIQSGRPVTDGETLRSVDNITVVQDRNDPEVLRANITITAASGKTVDFQQVLKIA